MKKMKWTIMFLAIIVSVCGAFATRPHYDCTQLTQYYISGTTYFPAGTYGITYICEAGSVTCTYYTNNGGITYTPCQLGQYTPCQGCIVKAPAAQATTSNPTR